MRNFVKKHQQLSGSGAHTTEKDYRRLKIAHDKEYHDSILNFNEQDYEDYEEQLQFVRSTD